MSTSRVSRCRSRPTARRRSFHSGHAPWHAKAQPGIGNRRSRVTRTEAATGRDWLEVALERGHDFAVAANIADGLDSQDLRVPVAEELLRLLPDCRSIAAAAAHQHRGARVVTSANRSEAPVDACACSRASGRSDRCDRVADDRCPRAYSLLARSAVAGSAENSANSAKPRRPNSSRDRSGGT